MDEILHKDEQNLLSYLDGEMEEEEKLDFENRLINEPELRQRLAKLQIAVSAVRQYGAGEKVRSIHKEMMPAFQSLKKGRVISMPRIIRYSMAAAASVIILFFAVKLITANRLSADKLYDEAYVSYDAGTVRGAVTVSPVEEAYRSGNYRMVTERAIKGNLSSHDSLLTGISFLNLDRYDSAVNWLTALSRQGAYRQDAEFYLALAWLKAKDITPAVRMMKKIRMEKTHVYRDQFPDEYIDKVEGLR